MIALIASEWVKVRSARYAHVTLCLLGLVLALVALVAWNVAAMWDGFSAAQRETMSIGSLPYLAVWFAEPCLGAFGVLAISSEYVTHAIQASLIAEPRRGRWLVAKASFVGVASLAAGLFISFGAFFVCEALIGDRPITGNVNSFQSEWPMLLALALLVPLFALLGFAIATAMRSTMWALAAILVLWHPIPVIARDLPPPWDTIIGSLVPGALAAQIAGVSAEGSIYSATLGSSEAIGVWAAYIVIPLICAIALMKRRDIA